MIRRRQGGPEYWKSDALARLKERGCPVCAHLIQQLPSHFFWFINEQYYEQNVVATLQDSYGLCPIHTRHFLQTGSNSVIATVFSYVIDYVLVRLREAQSLLSRSFPQEKRRELCREAFEILRSKGSCHTCEGMKWWNDHVIYTLLRALADPEVKMLYQRSVGFCLPHFRQASHIAAEWGDLSFFNEQMRQRLKTLMDSNGSPLVLFEQIAGLDKNRSLRRKEAVHKTSNFPPHEKEQITVLPNQEWSADAASWSPTFDRICAALAEPGCPVCIACERGLKDYYRWLGMEMEKVASPSVHWDPSWEVCSSHLWEFCVSGYERAATLIGQHTLLEWLGRLDDLAARLDRQPSDRLLDLMGQLPMLLGNHFRGGGWRPLRQIRHFSEAAAEVLESPRRKLDRFRAVALREHYCQACRHIQTTTHRTLDLILRVVEDSVGGQTYQQSWGLCLRHSVEAARLADNPKALSEIVTVQIGRLRILEWELHEFSRKHNWSVRYEPGGPESSAWQRAAYQLCGSIL